MVCQVTVTSAIRSRDQEDLTVSFWDVDKIAAVRRQNPDAFEVSGCTTTQAPALLRGGHHIGMGMGVGKFLQVGILLSRCLPFRNYSHAKVGTGLMVWSQGTDSRSHPVTCYESHCCHSSQFSSAEGGSTNLPYLSIYHTCICICIWVCVCICIQQLPTLADIHHNFHQQKRGRPGHQSSNLFLSATFVNLAWHHFCFRFSHSCLVLVYSPNLHFMSWSSHKRGFVIPQHCAKDYLADVPVVSLICLQTD